MQTYFEKLKSPKWQKRRLLIMERDEFKCCRCNDTENNLQVHHKYYTKNTDPWNYPDEALTTLCEECHENETHYAQKFKALVNQMYKEHSCSEELWFALSSYYVETGGREESVIYVRPINQTHPDYNPSIHG
jgi:hypothetical protein